VLFAYRALGPLHGRREVGVNVFEVIYPNKRSIRLLTQVMQTMVNLHFRNPVSE
jgi:hypothetical protein